VAKHVADPPETKFERHDPYVTAAVVLPLGIKRGLPGLLPRIDDLDDLSGLFSHTLRRSTLSAVSLAA
jgi:hypothetical protein